MYYCCAMLHLIRLNADRLTRLSGQSPRFKITESARLPINALARVEKAPRLSQSHFIRPLRKLVSLEREPLHLLKRAL